MCAVGALGRLFWDEKTGVLAALIYATSLLPVMVATTVNTDSLLCLFEVLAVLLFWLAQPRGDTRAGRLCLLGMWGAFALAFLTKGPPGLLPLAAILAYRFFLPREQRRPRLFPRAGLILFLAAGFWWYFYIVWKFANPAPALTWSGTPWLRWPAVLADHFPMIRYYLGEEIINRVASNEFKRNPQWFQPLIMYVPLLMFGGGAWAWYFWKPARALRPNRDTVPDLLRAAGPKLFLALWLLLPLFVFSLSQSRLPDYVLPLFPAVALACARLAAKRDWAGDGAPARRPFRIAAVSAALLIVIKGVSGSVDALHERLVAKLPQRPAAGLLVQLDNQATKDMTLLYRLCRNYDDPATTTFVQFLSENRLGFDFYANSPVWRVVSEHEESPRGMLPEEFAARLRGTDPARRILLIVENRERKLRVLRDFATDNNLAWNALPIDSNALILAELRPAAPQP